MLRRTTVLTVLLLSGCQSTGQFTVQRRIQTTPGVAPAGIVIVANGAGDFRDLSINLDNALNESYTPLRVETFAWSRGQRRVLDDQIDHDNHREQGRRLAETVGRYRCGPCPRSAIYLVGNSAGCEIVLSAAEWLPPDSVDRMILLAPSVCAYRDLRPALRSARGGIDVFTSHRDRIILGLGMRVTGTTEGDCTIAAGRTGFRPFIASAADAALHQRLRQHPWEPAQRAYGHNGGHFGSTTPVFLESNVVPLLASCP